MQLVSFGYLFNRLRSSPVWVRFVFYWLLKFIFVCLLVNMSSVLVNYLYGFKFFSAHSILFPGFPPGPLTNWTDVGLLLAARGAVGLLLALASYWVLRLLDADYLFGLLGACAYHRQPAQRRHWRQDLATTCVVVLVFRACWDVLLYLGAYGLTG
jgi:hypothetical protein